MTYERSMISILFSLDYMFRIIQTLHDQPSFWSDSNLNQVFLPENISLIQILFSFEVIPCY